MRLVYSKTGEPVQIGDVAEVNGIVSAVKFFAEPHMAASQGKVLLESGAEFYVSVIGAVWIEREDSGPLDYTIRGTTAV